ncbi:MAG: hypothetical protein H6Q15_163 [Bacteroidetes bacterium]|nr:hypothetical protein [Bacteroidota bacterium]
MKIKKHLSIIILLLSISTNLFAYEFIKENDILLHGFQKKISGNDFSYHYPMPNISNSLLIRGNKILGKMEFETQSVPLDYNNETAIFVMPCAIGSNGFIIDMYVSINGKKEFTFSTQAKEQWSIKNESNKELSFENIAFDANHDMKGLMYLRIPISQIEKGKPLKISVEAKDENVSTWFILYTDQIIPKIKAKLYPAIVNDKGIEKQKVFIDVVHFAPKEMAKIIVDGNLVSEQMLKLGYNSIQIEVPKVNKPKNITIDVISSINNKREVIELIPSRLWKLNFVQHSHTDIGYTRPQTEILAEHIRYIDYALDYCDLTDNYPEESKFRWTCESAWAVEEYLQTRPASQIERLKKRIKEGRIELTGMLYNFEEIPDETSLASSLKPIKELRKYGLDVKVAMQNDVNGIGWCFADYFPELGVKYLNMGTHGHRALICFDYPTLFRWQSPSGNEMIAYRAEHYNIGNYLLGVENEDYNNFEIKTLEYLAELESKGYPYNIAQVQFSGYTTDNSPPSIQACENIRKFNEKFEYPKLRIAICKDFFEEAEKRYKEELPIIKGAWPDWWTDGFGASARETSASRLTHNEVISGINGYAMAKILGAKIPQNTTQKYDNLIRSLLFFDEHTTGYSESVREPFCEQTMLQREIKESYVWEAYRGSKILNEGLQGILQEFVNKKDKPTIVVYNPSSFSRSGIMNVYIDHEILPMNKGFEIKDNNGIILKAQPKMSRSDGTYWDIWVEDIPGLGSKQYIIELKGETLLPNSIIKPEKNTNIITTDNQWYSINIDKKRGVINRLFDKELNKELLDKNSEYSLGEFILEELSERSSMESFRMGAYKRFSLDTIWYIGLKRGEIYDSYKFCGNTKTGIDMESQPNYYFEIHVFNTEKRIELAYSLIKKSIIEPESFYIAMPFALDSSNIYFEVQGGLVKAGVDQIEGSSNDWNTVQNFASVRNNNEQIILVSNEIPLMQFGNINTGRYKKGALPESSHIYSWPMNNYWTTNFNAEQRGEFRWTYQISSRNNTSNSEATKFAINTRIPLLARVLTKDNSISKSNKQPNSNKEPFGSLLNIEGENILLVNMKAEDNKNEILLQLRELDGKETPIKISSNYIKNLKIRPSNAIGEDLKGELKNIKPKETKFIKIYF